ncbi:MAG: spore maturation protein [Clostridia bacterium]|nr:spore maturation protein [Clostridia bacterium]
MIKLVSDIAIPCIIFILIINGIIKKINIFDCFTKGAKEGFSVSIKILPSLIGLVTAVSMLRASGFFDFAGQLLSPVLSKIGFPPELVPLAVIRPVSGSAALAAVKDIFTAYGADSFAGKCASVMMGSTETTFYTLTVYFGSIGINNTKYTVKSALLADLTGIITSVILVRLLLY